MAENMQKRKDELFINVQQGGQYSIFDNVKTISTSMENEILSASEIAAKLKEHIMKFTGDIKITKLLATFVNEYGITIISLNETFREEIAEVLYISENTVKYHKSNMLAKTGFATAVDLAFHMLSNGWINPKY